MPTGGGKPVAARRARMVEGREMAVGAASGEPVSGDM